MNVIAINPGRSSAFSAGTLREKYALDLPASSNADVDCAIADPAETFIARGILFALAVSVPLWAAIIGAYFLVRWTMA